MIKIVDFSSDLKGLAGVGPCVLAIGNFDGVHAGHVELLEIAKSLADKDNLPLVVLTFEPHPRAVLFPDKPLKRLTDKGQKAALLGQQGVLTLAVLAFDRAVAGWTPEYFMDEVLVKGLQAQIVVVGENFRFGHKASGTIDTLMDYEGFGVVGVALVEDEGGVVSSTRLRDEGMQG